jgi:hypothetical protein
VIPRRAATVAHQISADTTRKAYQSSGDPATLFYEKNA